MDPLVNCHTHIFTIDHVPGNFGRKVTPWYLTFVRISHVKWLYKNVLPRVANLWILRAIKALFGWGITKVVMNLLGGILKPVFDYIYSFLFDEASIDIRRRFIAMGKYATLHSQAEIFARLSQFYPSGTEFVVLTMDMEYMNGGKPKVGFHDQINEVINLKSRNQNLHPFLFIDPRRISIDPDFTFDHIEKLLIEEFEGVKLYPPLGYYPFDWRLIKVYEIALRLNRPVMTHCAEGIVHFRGKKKKEWIVHPVGNIPLTEMSVKKFPSQFTHPLNYLFVTNKSYLQSYLNTLPSEILEEHFPQRAPDLSQLKICLAHWGGAEHWNKYLKSYWDVEVEGPYDGLDSNLEKFRMVWENFSWFSICSDLMKMSEYRFYCDISFTLHEEKYLSLLKVSLEDPDIKDRILFGTDFYVVAQKETEREFGIDVRGYIGEDLFDQIARSNPRKFLY